MHGYEVGNACAAERPDGTLTGAWEITATDGRTVTLLHHDRWGAHTIRRAVRADGTVHIIPRRLIMTADDFMPVHELGARFGVHWAPPKPDFTPHDPPVYGPDNPPLVDYDETWSPSRDWEMGYTW